MSFVEYFSDPCQKTSDMFDFESKLMIILDNLATDVEGQMMGLEEILKLRTNTEQDRVNQIKIIKKLHETLEADFSFTRKIILQTTFKL